MVVLMGKIRIVTLKACWVPTLWGWILLLALFFTAAVVGVFNVQGFLSPVDPERNAEALVVEGWLPDYTLEAAVHEFKTHPYNLCIATGGTMEEGNYLSKYKTFADVAYLTLRKLGIDSQQIVSVPSPLVNKDRTYASSVALREWFESSGRSVHSLNVFSLGCHSRRSRMLFSKALGKKVAVGVIACSDRSYDARRWWHYSSGLRSVIGEAMVYVYALFFSLK